MVFTVQWNTWIKSTLVQLIYRLKNTFWLTSSLFPSGNWARRLMLWKMISLHPVELDNVGTVWYSWCARLFVAQNKRPHLLPFLLTLFLSGSEHEAVQSGSIVVFARSGMQHFDNIRPSVSRSVGRLFSEALHSYVLSGSANHVMYQIADSHGWVLFFFVLLLLFEEPGL